MDSETIWEGKVSSIRIQEAIFDELWSMDISQV